MATRGSDDVATKPGHSQQARIAKIWPPPEPGGGDLPPGDSPDGQDAAGQDAAGQDAAGPGPASLAGVASLDEERSRRRILLGRLAAVFYLGGGVLGLITLPLPAPGANRPAMTLLGVAALAAAAATWQAPWGRWPHRALLVIVPPAFVLIALANTFGGSDLHAYGVFFVVVFVWAGLAQPPRTSLYLAPLAAAAYLLPMLWLPGDVSAGLASAATVIPVCVLVGEGIAWGMTRLERIERALHHERHEAGQLRDLDRMKDAFLSAVSHELRTPLTICRGHLDVLDAGSEAEVRAVKEMLVGEIDLMGRLVEDLTTLARAGEGLLLMIEPLPLDAFVTSIAAMAAPVLGGRLVVDTRTDGATLHADPQRLTQALLNLLQNAAGHTRGGGQVWLRVRPEPGCWRFDVADEGGGLPPGEERLVFEPFSTGSSATGRTGLGLAIVRGIARAHGGEAGVVNRPPRGATFWIRIPR